MIHGSNHDRSPVHPSGVRWTALGGVTAIAAFALVANAFAGSMRTAMSTTAQGAIQGQRALQAEGALRQIGDVASYQPAPAEVTSQSEQSLAARRRWPSPTPAATPAPAGSWRGVYYNNVTLSGWPVLSRDDGSALDFSWPGSPAPDVNADYFSVRWTRTFTFDPGTYRFTLTHDDGARLLVDGNVVMQQLWMQAPTQYVADYTIAAGTHTVTVEYFTTYGDAVVALAISRLSGASVVPTATVASVPSTATPTRTPLPATATATRVPPTATFTPAPTNTPAPTATPAPPVANNGDWLGVYYNNTVLGDPAAFTRDDGTLLNFYWPDAPAPGVNADYFSARWGTTFTSGSGVYRFYLTHDDGARLYVDGNLVLDNWLMQGPTTYAADVSLAPGPHLLGVEYYHTWGGAVMQLGIQPLAATTPTATPTSGAGAPAATSTSTPAPPAATATPVPVTATPTRTPVPPTATPTRTPVPPTPTSTPVPPAASSTSNSPELMVSDETQPHEGCLDKNYVDGFSWQYGPDTGWWNLAPPAGFAALTGWFAVTTDASPTCTTQSPAANVRVEIRNYRTYAYANGVWRLVQDQNATGLGSDLFYPNYQWNSAPLNVRNEPDGGQSWLPTRAGLWHGWPGGRASIPAGTTAVCTQFQARLVLDNLAGPDNRPLARFLAEAGFDWWQGLTSGTNALGMNGRYKLVPQDGSYRWFNGCGAASSLLLSNPPPYQ